MYKLFIVLFLFPFYALSQKYSVERPDESLQSDPYTQTYFSDKNDYKKIASVLTLVKNRHSGFNTDTLSQTVYNNDGLQISSTRYDNNKKTSVTELKYDDHNNLINWQTFEKKQSTLTVYTYNPNRQLISTRQYRIMRDKEKPDSTQTSRMDYTYNGALLTEINNYNFGNKVTEIFEYSQQRLVSKTGSYISGEFFYNNKGYLIKVLEYSGSEISAGKLMGLKKYAYNIDGQLIADSVLTASNLKSNKFQVTFYEFHKDASLHQMRVSYGTAFRNVIFNYKNNRLKEVNIETNEGNSAYLKFWMSHRIGDYYSFPINYQEVFNYDKYGNRTSKNIFVNKELFSEVEYLIIYK